MAPAARLAIRLAEPTSSLVSGIGARGAGHGSAAEECEHRRCANVDGSVPCSARRAHRRGHQPRPHHNYSLFHNDGERFFSDVSYLAGVGEPTVAYLGWVTNFLD